MSIHWKIKIDIIKIYTNLCPYKNPNDTYMLLKSNIYNKTKRRSNNQRNMRILSSILESVHY